MISDDGTPPGRIRSLIARGLGLLGAPEHPHVVRRGRVLAVGALAGLTAGILTDAVDLGLRHLSGAPSLPEDLQDLIVPHIPASTFATLLSSLGAHGKELVVAGSLVGVALVITAIGVLYAALCARGWRPVRLAFVLFVAATLVNLALFGSILDANDRGGSLLLRRLIGIGNTALAVAVGATAVAVLLGRRAIRVELAREPADEAGMSRRGFVSLAAWFGGGLILGAAGLSASLRSFAGATNLGYEGRGTPSFPLPDAITPTDAHYVVSKNIIDPSVDADAWRLEVTGLVEHATTLRLDDLRALPQLERVITTECISNGVGGTLMSTARWRGPLLRDVIGRAGRIDSRARFGVVTAVDDYDDSLSIDVITHPATMLALEMNGAPLPARHGFPARIINPGHYGEKQMKWLARIELSEADHLGFYQREGYSSTAEVTTFSRVDSLRAGSHIAAGAPVLVRGHAYAGTRRISRVEVSVDDGRTFSAATLDAELSPWAWRFWSWMWAAPTPGMHSVVVRATDGSGATQEDRYVDYVPRGASGLHRFPVSVV